MARRRTALQAISLFSFQDIITSVTGIMVLVLLVLALELVQSQFGTPAAQNTAIASQAEEVLEDVREQIAKLEKRLAVELTADDPTLSPQSYATQESSLRTSNLEQTRDLKEKLAKTERLEKLNEAAKQTLANSFSTKKKIEEITAKQAEIDRKRANLKDGQRLVYNPGLKQGKRPWLVQLEETAIVVAPGLKQEDVITFKGTATTRETAFLLWARKLGPSTDYLLILVKPGTVDNFNTIEQELVNRGFSVAIDLIGSSQSAIEPESESDPPAGDLQ